MKIVSLNLGGTGATNAADARTNLELGSYAIKNANTITLVAANTATANENGKLLLADTDTGTSFTVTLPAVSTVGEGYTIGVKKIDSSANTVTIDGNGSETIDGSLTRTIDTQHQVEWYHCTGSEWWVTSSLTGATTAGANIQVFTATGSGTWTKPANKTIAYIQLWGGGGGGGAATASQKGGGGGGGSYLAMIRPISDYDATEDLNIGGGGSGGSAGHGGQGSHTYFAVTGTDLRTLGGGGGEYNDGVTWDGTGGGGGGNCSSGGRPTGGWPSFDNATDLDNEGYGGGSGGAGSSNGSNAIFGGSGGGYNGGSGGKAIYGGGGGGSGDSSGGSGGTSIYGGNGGAGGSTGSTDGTSGTQPGGGGGGGYNGGNGGAGGAGKIIVTCW